MNDEIRNLTEKFLKDIAAADTIAALEEVRLRALGKRGEVSLLLQKIKTVPADERKSFGQAVNEAKTTLQTAIDDRLQTLQMQDLQARLQEEKIDTSLPPHPAAANISKGSLHPVRQVTNEIIAILGTMGFACAEGPEIEDDFHNFTALNIPANHPARQMQDTFYIDPPPNSSGGATTDTEESMPKVLRTHTSPVQVRTMQSQSPPIRVIAPGRTYRCDSDITHTPMFHQVEGLVIDEHTHFGHLKGCVYDFCRAYFEVKNVKLQFRPSYFPFTEPSAEVDIAYHRKDGELRLGDNEGGSAQNGGEGKGEGGWMEILGCGMVHPNVLRNCGIDPQKYQGFAFGMGIERLAMLKYGMADLRQFYEGDVRWLKHYGFSPFAVPDLVRGLNL